MNKDLELLDLMIKDMNKQINLYKPTTFWTEGSKVIIDELRKEGVKSFRKLASCRTFFVPSYSFPHYYINKGFYQNLKDEIENLFSHKLTNKKLENFLDGTSVAYSDYRVLKASNIDKKPYLDNVSESEIAEPIEQFEFENRKFSRSFLNYLLGLSFLKQHVDTTVINNVMEIGGGFGSLGEILLSEKRNEDMFYINADIPPVSFVSGYYLKKLFGKENIADFGDLRNDEVLNIEELKNKYKALNICSWQIEKLKGNIDLFVNFISFQEMEPDVVNNYCKYIRKLNPKYILLRNMEEGKRKKSDGAIYGVNTPILGNDYNNFLPEYELLAIDTEIFGFKTEDDFHSQLRLYIKRS